MIKKHDALLYVAALLAYIGIAAFFAAFGPNMSNSIRLMITLGGGMFLHLLAMKTWQSSPAPLLGNCLLLPAAVLEAAGLYLLLVKAFPELAASGSLGLPVMLFMAAQEFMIYRHYRIAAIAVYAIVSLYGVAFILLHLLGGEESMILLCLSASGLLVAHGLRSTTAHASVPICYVLGCCVFYTSLFSLTRGSAAELLYVAAIIAGFTCAIRLRSAALLWSATAFTIAYSAYGDTAYLMHSSLWSLSLPVLGLVIFGCISTTLKVKHRYFVS